MKKTLIALFASSMLAAFAFAAEAEKAAPAADCQKGCAKDCCCKEDCSKADKANGCCKAAKKEHCAKKDDACCKDEKSEKAEQKK
jgi:hypothetical protein